MCGIFSISSLSNDLETLNIKKISKSLNRRGPDFFASKNLFINKLIFCHSRLAIQDCTSLANQPMTRKNSFYTIVYNGEIYNHFHLRSKYLKNSYLATSSDTETIIALFDKIGIQETLSILDGMISIVIYSSKTNNIYFYRDLTGQKPLFFCISSDKSKIGISSSPSIFYRCTNFFNKDFDTYNLNNYISYGFTNSDSSIYKGLYNCLPGVLYNYDVEKNEINKNFINKVENDNFCSDNDSDKKYHFEILTDSIRSSLIGTRNCGLLLSGGVDSTAVAIACSKENYIKRAYTLTYPHQYDPELKQAEETAKHLDYEHIIINLETNQCINIATDLASIIDYPNPDSSIIPTSLISKIASNNDTILLTGDGGDEIFGGYNRYQSFVRKYSKIFEVAPVYFKKIILKKYLSNFITLLNSSVEFKLDILEVISKQKRNLLDAICSLDQSLYMVQHTLPKADRALMFNSMEGRAPLLNNKIRNLGSIYRKKDVGKCDKYFLRSYIKSRIGNIYKNQSKKGFSANIHNLMSQKSFYETVRSSVEELTVYFQSPECSINNDYLSKILDPSNKLSKSQSRNLWLLHGIASCHRYYV